MILVVIPLIHVYSIKSLPSLRKPSVPDIGPGANVLTLTPLGPHSTARCLVMASVDRERNCLFLGGFIRISLLYTGDNNVISYHLQPWQTQHAPGGPVLCNQVLQRCSQCFHHAPAHGDRGTIKISALTKQLSQI